MRELILTLLLLPAAAAQPSVSVAGVAAVPQGAFAESASPAGGVSVGAYVAVPRTPVAVGLEGMAARLGSEWRMVPAGIGRTAVTTTSGLAQGLAVLRIQRRRGVLRPYLDAVAGVTYVTTTSGPDGVPTDRDDEGGTGARSCTPMPSCAPQRVVPASVAFGDAAGLAGIGVGVQVGVGRSGPRQTPRVALDARVRVLAGAEAEHVAPADVVHYGDVTVGVLARHSRTDLVVPHLGVTVGL